MIRNRKKNVAKIRKKLKIKTGNKFFVRLLWKVCINNSCL